MSLFDFSLWMCLIAFWTVVYLWLASSMWNKFHSLIRSCVKSSVYSGLDLKVSVPFLHPPCPAEILFQMWLEFQNSTLNKWELNFILLLWHSGIQGNSKLHSVDDSYVLHLHINITDLSLKHNLSPRWNLQTGYCKMVPAGAWRQTRSELIAKEV